MDTDTCLRPKKEIRVSLCFVSVDVRFYINETMDKHIDRGSLSEIH